MAIIVKVVKVAIFHRLVWYRGTSKLVFKVGRDRSGDLSVLAKEVLLSQFNHRRGLVLTLKTVSGLQDFEIGEEVKARKGWNKLSGGRVFELVLEMAEKDFRTNIRGELMEEIA